MTSGSKPPYQCEIHIPKLASRSIDVMSAKKHKPFTHVDVNTDGEKGGALNACQVTGQHRSFMSKRKQDIQKLDKEVVHARDV